MSDDRGRSQKIIYLVAFLLLAGGLAYLVAGGLKQNSVYFLNVSEALARDLGSVGQARLFGKVQAEGLSRSDERLGVAFNLADKENPDKTLRIHYGGAVPDSFKPGVEVIVEGRMASGGKHFQADNLMTKCPSKYEKRKD
jgi:cytochrome c-type biogenesis protein CcmE